MVGPVPRPGPGRAGLGRGRGACGLEGPDEARPPLVPPLAPLGVDRRQSRRGGSRQGPQASGSVLILGGARASLGGALSRRHVGVERGGGAGARTHQQPRVDERLVEVKPVNGHGGSCDRGGVRGRGDEGRGYTTEATSYFAGQQLCLLHTRPSAPAPGPEQGSPLTPLVPLSPPIGSSTCV